MLTSPEANMVKLGWLALLCLRCQDINNLVLLNMEWCSILFVIGSFQFLKRNNITSIEGSETLSSNFYTYINIHYFISQNCIVWNVALKCVHLQRTLLYWDCFANILLFFFNLISSFCFVERLIVVAEHYESNLSDFQKQGKAVR